MNLLSVAEPLFDLNLVFFRFGALNDPFSEVEGSAISVKTKDYLNLEETNLDVGLNVFSQLNSS